jgi:uncharacterized protein YjdB
MNGKNIKISWGMGTILSTKADKITIDGETMEIAAAIAQYKTRIAGCKSWSLTTDFLFKNGEEFYALLDIGTNVAITVMDENDVERLLGYATMQTFDANLTRGSLAAGAVTFLGNGPLEVPVTSITLEPSFLSLPYNGQQTVVATVHPASATNKELLWASSNTSVARVSQSGVVTAYAEGNCTITVSAKDGSGVSTTLAVSVYNVAVTGLTVSPTTLTLQVGQTATITPTVTPSNAGDTSVTWQSSDRYVAEVDEHGVVTAVGAGTCDIICIANGNTAITARCEVGVQGPPVLITKIDIQPPMVVVGIGESVQLDINILPANATNKHLTWSVYDPGTCSVTEDGLVTGLAGGHTAIFATAQDGSGVTKQVNVSVS